MAEAADPLTLAGDAARRLAFSLLPRVLNGAIDAARFFADGTVRIGVTGLSRAGKTAFLTSVAANLLARQNPRFTLAPMGAGDVARFDHPAHLAALAADPPAWPARTDTVSVLALNVLQDRGAVLPARKLRLEFLDYPGEWLLDLPLLTQSFAQWSAQMLQRLEAPALAPFARDFLAFAKGLPHNAGADEKLAEAGFGLYRTCLQGCREAGFSYLQPGRHLMPAPGAQPPWVAFFPHTGTGGLQNLLADRYGAYRDAVRRDLASPMFADVDRLIVLADVLSALHGGKAAFDDAHAALTAAASSLRFQFDWWGAIAAISQLRRPPRVISRIAFAATKADHVGERQRGNLKNLMAAMAPMPAGDINAAYFAIASVRCTEDFVRSLQGRPVSAVRGMIAGQPLMQSSFPGEVPDLPPDGGFWQHPFLSLPDFLPMRLPEGGRLGVPNIDIDKLLSFVLADIV